MVRDWFGSAEGTELAKRRGTDIKRWLRHSTDLKKAEAMEESDLRWGGRGAVRHEAYPLSGLLARLSLGWLLICRGSGEHAASRMGGGLEVGWMCGCVEEMEVERGVIVGVGGM